MNDSASPGGDLLDFVTESMVVMDAGGRILDWNAGSGALYGWSRDEAVGRLARDLFGPGEQAVRDAAGAALARAAAWRGEAVRQGRDGTERTVELVWRPRRSGEAGEIVEIGRDVTAARRSEAELRRSEHRYRNLFQAMAASFWELDFAPVGEMLYRLRKSGAVDRFDAYFAGHPEFVREMMRATRVVDVNDQTVRLFGRGDRRELLGSVEPFWPPSSSEVYAQSVVAAITGKANYARETRLRTIDGREFPALFTACFPADTMNRGTLLVGVIDLTEQAAAQAALARMQSDLAHAARVSMLGELAASIAHEVNQPLGAIAANGAAGMRWLGRERPDLDEVRALTARIVADARRAADIIGRIRALAAGTAPDPASIPVNGVVEESVLFLRHEIERHGARVELRLARGLPDVLADRIQLQQVVVNLAVNALQAMAGAAVSDPRLVLRTRPEGARVVVEVEDNGPGIAPEHLPRLFDSFFTTRADGMGMGLAIARSIVEAAAGTIAAGAAPSGGARFAIALPALPHGDAAHTKV